MIYRLTSLVFASLLLINPAAADKPEPQGLQVLVTVKPIHSLVSAVLGGHGKAHLLVQGNASPYDLSPGPAFTKRLQRADLLVWVGPAMESGLVAVLGADPAPDITVLTVQDLNLPVKLPSRDWIDPLKSEPQPDTLDPHVWLNPGNAVAILAAVTEQLAALDPKRAQEYRQNTLDYIDRLRPAFGQKAPLSQKGGMVMMNDSLAYAEALHGASSPVAVMMTEPGAAVDAARRQQIEAGGMGASCIIAEPQYTALSAAMIGRKLGASVRMADAFGSDIASGPDLYPALLAAMSELFTQCGAAPQP